MTRPHKVFLPLRRLSLCVELWCLFEPPPPRQGQRQPEGSGRRGQQDSDVQQRATGHLVYHCPKPRPDGPGDLVPTPLELINGIAALEPPPRTHRHRHCGVLAPTKSRRLQAMRRCAGP